MVVFKPNHEMKGACTTIIPPVSHPIVSHPISYYDQEFKSLSTCKNVPQCMFLPMTCTSCLNISTEETNS